MALISRFFGVTELKIEVEAESCWRKDPDTGA
jgi:hypothetical protein